MPGTYSQLLYHIVFSTKHRLPHLTPEITERLYPYIGGIIRAENGTLFSINGIEDHLHLYLRYRPDDTISNLMRSAKSRSSLFLHQTFPSLKTFAWQEGYAAFTVSKSQEPALKKYIANQKSHHQKESFQSELLRLLQKHEIDYDERYIFD